MAVAEHKPELDGIRGMAILGVLVAHSSAYLAMTPATKPLIAAMNLGQWGVDLFFCLSGFLITGILLETIKASNYLQSFYVRRALRIMPLYYAVLGVLLMLALAHPWVASRMPVRGEWPAYVFYTQNVPAFLTVGKSYPFYLVSHFWSLAVEEQFYFVWPWVVLLVSETGILWLCGMGLLLALPLRIYSYWHIFHGSWGEMIVTPNRMDGLLIGAACVIVVRRWRSFPLWLVVLPACLGIGILGWIATTFNVSEEFIGSGPHMRTFGITAVALLSGSLMGISQMRLPWVKRFLGSGPLRFFGRYAYGIYIFHAIVYRLTADWIAPRFGISVPLPLLQGILFIVAINSISVILALLSFHVYEQNFLRLKGPFRPRFAEAGC